MLADQTSDYEQIPLRFMMTPPASFDEAWARGSLAAGRWFGQCWETQRALENCAVRIQACLFGTAEQLWRKSLEASYLRAPRHAQRINVA